MASVRCGFDPWNNTFVMHTNTQKGSRLVALNLSSGNYVTERFTHEHLWIACSSVCLFIPTKSYVTENVIAVI